jgi:hypothetical protein
MLKLQNVQFRAGVICRPPRRDGCQPLAFFGLYYSSLVYPQVHPHSHRVSSSAYSYLAERVGGVDRNV